MWHDGLVANKQAPITNTQSLQPMYAELNHEANELQQQKNTQVLSAKNRKQRLQFTLDHQNWTM